MASSLIGGLVAKTKEAAEHLYLFEPNSEKATELKSCYGLNLASNNEELVLNCDVIVVAVKPQTLKNIIVPLRSAFAEKQPLIISVVAGIRATSIEKWLERDVALIRVMPNTPALIGKGASGLYANKNVSAGQKAIAQSMLDAVGLAEWVESESDIDSITALSGSGPAYFMLFIQGLIEASVKAGIAPETAEKLALQTAIGSAQLVLNSDIPLQKLIDNVTSPNGTTEQALSSFSNNNLKGIIEEAFNSARKRSTELADDLG